MDVNPACAGMILSTMAATPTALGKPRVCGDDPFVIGLRQDIT